MFSKVTRFNFKNNKINIKMNEFLNHILLTIAIFRPIFQIYFLQKSHCSGMLLNKLISLIS